ncbi:MAG TPA: ABC transporter ATP-binding protein [Longimicrobiales bacterium]|nr:ABC transporter ATP-binding protein [Longimicrobiales bacterium]
MPLRLEGLTHAHADGSVALHPVDLEVAEGEILVVTGGTGSGKSTLLELVAGRRAPTAGAVRLPAAGAVRPPAGAADSAAAGVLLLTTRSPLPSAATLRESLRFDLPPADAERGMAGAARLGLKDRLEVAPEALSGGERQSALLARAVATLPALLLLDDALAPMEPALRVLARAELARLAGGGTTVLLATPDPAEALRMGGRAAVLQGGRVQQVAPASAVYERPATLSVAAFFGAPPPMNLFPGTLVRVENGVRFRCASFTLAVAPLDPGGEEVVLGVRPEHVLLVGVKPDRAGSPDALATVRRVEALGAGALVHCRTEEGEELLAYASEPPDLHPEQLVGVRMDRAHLHLFDRASGERVAQPPAVGERWWVG